MSEAEDPEILFEVRGGLAVEVPVRIGLRSDEAAEVLSGLEDGEEVIVGKEARDLAPGTPVREHPLEAPPA